MIDANKKEIILYIVIFLEIKKRIKFTRCAIEFIVYLCETYMPMC